LARSILEEDNLKFLHVLTFQSYYRAANSSVYYRSSPAVSAGKGKTSKGFQIGGQG
jgi:hypothetical protein